MRSTLHRLSSLACALALSAAPLAAQRRATAPTAISADTLRARLFALADDSMAGRGTATLGNARAAEWVAAYFQRYGLQPAGENGGYFQTLSMTTVALDTANGLEVGGTRLRAGTDVMLGGQPSTWTADHLTTIYGGTVGDSASWPAPGVVAGTLVILKPQVNAAYRLSMASFFILRQRPEFAGAAGFAVIALEMAPEALHQQVAGRLSRDSVGTPIPVSPVGVLVISDRAAAALLGAPIDRAVVGQTGPAVSGTVGFIRRPVAYPVRNVVGILPGRDPALRHTYVSLTAHNDHVGFDNLPVDHDSMRAFNQVVRPMGADTRNRAATPEEMTRIRGILDSLRRAHPARRDSIYNGADDDGSGTVALVELARVLSAGPRPKRSILFVSHAAEEVGLLGSAWYTDHATVPVDSIVAEIDEDMIGRGNATDLPEGGPAYLEVIGARRLSAEFGDTLEAANRRQARPFQFNYAYDAPGHPLQYYCRADHYSYARYGIPSVALSRGEHLDYHQVTDEAQYIDYAVVARLATLVREAALAIANMDHRPLVSGPRGDPHAPCRQ